MLGTYSILGRPGIARGCWGPYSTVGRPGIARGCWGPILYHGSTRNSKGVLGTYSTVGRPGIPRGVLHFGGPTLPWVDQEQQGGAGALLYPGSTRNSKGVLGTYSTLGPLLTRNSKGVLGPGGLLYCGSTMQEQQGGAGHLLTPIYFSPELDEPHPADSSEQS